MYWTFQTHHLHSIVYERSLPENTISTSHDKTGKNIIIIIIMIIMIMMIIIIIIMIIIITYPASLFG